MNCSPLQVKLVASCRNVKVDLIFSKKREILQGSFFSTEPRLSKISISSPIWRRKNSRRTFPLEHHHPFSSLLSRLTSSVFPYRVLSFLLPFCWDNLAQRKGYHFSLSHSRFYSDIWQLVYLVEYTFHWIDNSLKKASPSLFKSKSKTTHLQKINWMS